MIPRILFICTGNAGRSQIAEALARCGWPETIEVCSAGVAPCPNLHPTACSLMAERGCPLEGQVPKSVREACAESVEWVVTIGDRALTECPEIPGNPWRVHWPIADPADADGTPRSEPLWRATLDEIESRMPEVVRLTQSLPNARSLDGVRGISTVVTEPERFEPAAHLPVFSAVGFRVLELCLAHVGES